MSEHIDDTVYTIRGILHYTLSIRAYTREQAIEGFRQHFKHTVIDNGMQIQVESADPSASLAPKVLQEIELDVRREV